MNRLIALLFITKSSLLIAQWQPDVRLTNNPAKSYTSNNNAWCIAASGNGVHVVWRDFRDGNWEIYYKRSTDGGIRWGADARLTNDTAMSHNPSIAVSGSIVHVIWIDFRDGNFEIYYKRSSDAGVSWGGDTRLTNNSASSGDPSLSVSGSVVHVVWYDFRDGNYEIYYKRSTNGGMNWGSDIRLTINSASSWSPSVGVSGSVAHVVWVDNRNGNWEIYYKRSADAGISWGADTRLTNSPDTSWYPSVTVSGSAIHVVWSDARDGNFEIYYKRSTDGGVSWGPDTRLTNNSANSEYPSVSVFGSAVHVVWQDPRDSNYEIYYKRDPTGNPIGIININSEIPKEFSLSQNYPNPFNPVTKIKFDVPSNVKRETSNMKLIIYGVLGREVATLVNEQLKPGTYEVEWDASNFPSGVYYYKLTAGDFVSTRKMVLLK